MKGSWTHALCDECWAIRCAARGEIGRVPVRVINVEETPAQCCCCGRATTGIHVREAPDYYEHPSNPCALCGVAADPTDFCHGCSSFVCLHCSGAATGCEPQGLHAVSDHPGPPPAA